MSDHEIFSIVPIEVWLDKRLTLEQVRVLGALLSFRGKNTNTVWPKREVLATRCAMPVAKISEATSSLVRLGWLEKNGRGGFSKPTSYTLTVPESVTVPQSGTVPPSGAATVTESVTRKELTSELTSELTKREARAKNGSRLPADWRLPEEWKAWAVERMGWTSDRCHAVAEIFADHWRSAAGSKGTKADWAATWRNWCRRETGQPATGRRAPRPDNFTDRDYGQGGRL
jgi:hypothetical protein